MRRKHEIDQLRWRILLLLIPYHAAMAWNAWGEPNYTFFESNRMISSIVVFFSPFFMPLLFVISGISTRSALDKRTNRAYLLERVQKLLVPLLSGTLLLMPVMTYIADTFHSSYRDGFFRHYAIFFTKYTDLTGADGGFSFGQFWFLLYLFVISFAGTGVIALVKRYMPKPQKPVSLRTVLLLGLPLPLLGELLSIGGKSLAEYGYLFLLGYYVFSEETITDALQQRDRLLCGIGLTAAALNIVLFLWMETEHVLLNSLVSDAAEWMMILGLLGFAKGHWNTQGRIADYMQRRSFLFYIYHFIWVVLFQFLLSRIAPDNTAVLFLGTVLLSYPATFLCCEITLRIPVLCLITGTKYRGNSRKQKSHP